MPTILESVFWRDTAVRATKTAAQTALGVGVTAATSLLDVDWLGVASASGLAAAASVLMSVATSDGPEVPDVHDQP